MTLVTRTAATTYRIIEMLFGVSITPGVVTLRAGRDGLRPLLRAIGATRGAEVGVWKGGHAHTLCAEVPGLHLLAVDPWDVYDGYKEQKNNPELMAAAYREAERRLSGRRCTLVRSASVEAAADVRDRSLDFVYIDANHLRDYVTHDLTAWAPKVMPGGLVAGHDYVANPRKGFIEVKDAVDAFVASRGIDPLFVLGGDTTPSFFWVVA